MPGAYAQPLVKGPSGRNLCRWCGTECAKPRQTFCSNTCIFEWRIRTSPSDLRRAVFTRDKGVCAGCGLDTEALLSELRKLKSSDKDLWEQRCLALGVPKHRADRSLWDCDHIVEVAAGGGGSGLANAQSLCLWCHKKKTTNFVKKLRSK